MVIFLKFEDNTQRHYLGYSPFCPLREIEFNIKNVRFLGNPTCSLRKISIFFKLYIPNSIIIKR